jgi:hypothetical protein
VLREVPNAESGFSPAYKNVVSWKNATTSLPFETVPQAAFNRLFAGITTSGGGGTGTTDAAAAMKRALYRQSVLDSVKQDVAYVQARGSAADQAKMDQYLSSVRDLEKRIQSSVPAGGGSTGTGGSGGGVAACSPGTPPAAGTPADIRQHVTQMIDIMVLAMQCDATRVLTFYYENTVTSLVHGFLGVNVDYHGSVTHHGNDPTKLANYAKVNQWVVSQLADLMTKMKAIREPDGTLLDNAVIFFSSEISDGNLHNHSNLPIVLAGHGGGQLNPGRAIQYQNANVADLFIAMLKTVGVSVTKFGADGVGPLSGL